MSETVRERPDCVVVDIKALLEFMTKIPEKKWEEAGLGGEEGRETRIVVELALCELLLFGKRTSKID